ncbi:RICIN domain-containing protein [Streptomyces europaeiscabiei]|uniref:RICIN domain-containing protein n=1 Tax=Streptomyces europaeiscabiei TaxID=146819 RepID=A0ABU4NLQ6_9ACTN|nr:RICIN domain-containing protein [Streptomyces europaeiscabiei]MDX2763450.1 RICIN domain-containing protein [Streptomyces europaeiscabiei]MDX2773146.1 RICIN domain-containing protein [Streptomyces europaeiscabiei]MDX3546182.1 RICIN domain-containing protein [Streptomyces europaeiscabiei]MDX3557512.1 RICIN domain-containing protein [Streptomyces europaeiscabiei]MDX3703581.1 RICIN domain-containing protein [Streptomyces europaeiscabiei]
MNNPTTGGRRGRHRRRWTATGLLLGAPALVVPYLLFAQEDSQAATVDGDAYYRLVSVQSGKVLDVNSFSTADGTRIQQWTDQNTANQQWKLKPTGGGYYELVNRNSGKVLGIAGDSTADKATAEQQTDSSSTSQEWRIDDVSGSDAVTFTSRRSGRVLDVSGGSTANGAAVIQYHAKGSTNQQWKLVRTAEPKAAGSGKEQTTAAAGPYVWNNAQVVGGGYVTGLVFNPREKGLLYARTDMGGAYRWDTAAEQWIPLTDWVDEKDWNLLGIDSLATDPVDPDRFYAAAGTYTNGWAGNAELLRSTDRGRTFKRTALPFKLGANEHGRGAGERLAINPADNGTLLLGTRKNGLWRSTDHGVTWSQVSSFPVKDGASSGAGIAFVTYGSAGSKTVYVGVADKSTSLYRSTDGGSTWQAVSGQPTGEMPQHGVVSGDGSLYLAYANSIGDATAGSVWKYTPGGEAWKDVSPSQGNYGFSGLAVDPQKPSTVMVATLHRWWPQDELYRTTDGGTTWKAQAAKSERDASGAPYVGTGIGHWMTALAIDPFNSGHVLYGTGSGIWRSKDAGATDNGGTSHWTVGSQGLEETALFDAIAPPGGATVISAMGDLGGFRHDSLTKVPAGRLDNPMMITSTDIDFAQSNPSAMVRVGRGGAQDGAYSTDGGSSWNGFKSEPVGDADSGQVALAADGSAIVWTQSGQAPYRSTDKGASWSKVGGLGTGAVVVADRSSAETFYSLHGGKLYASTDGGATFSARATNLPDGELTAVPGITGDLWISGGGKGLLHSTDGGRTFTTLTTVKSASALGFGKAAPGASYQALYLIGTVKDVTGVFRSTDKGATWLRVNDDAHQWGSIGGVGVITGDPDTFGRVYVGTNGRGLQYGNPS